MFNFKILPDEFSPEGPNIQKTKGPKSLGVLQFAPVSIVKLEGPGSTEASRAPGTKLDGTSFDPSGHFHLIGIYKMLMHIIGRSLLVVNSPTLLVGK